MSNSRASRAGWFCLLLLGLTGCGGLLPHKPITSDIVLPTPTVAAVFNRPVRPELVATPIPNSALTSMKTGQARAEARYAEVPIYNDTLSPGWTTEHSSGMRIDDMARAYIHTGATAIAATPISSDSELLLSVNDDARNTYRRQLVAGVSFWVNGGPNYIETDDLVVTVFGSNAYPYWVKDDNSVTISGRITKPNTPLFSQTRLYYLDINRAIPPNTWVEVTVLLDKLIYDPDYTYVTGMSIRNDPKFQNTFYIDDMRVLYYDTTP